MMAKTKKSKKTKSSKQPKKSKKPKASIRQERSTRRRQAVLMVLIFLSMGGYGIPRWVLWQTSHTHFDITQSPKKLYEKYLSRSKILLTFADWPGHKKVGKRAHLRLLSQASRALRKQRRRRTKNLRSNLQYTSYLTPDWLRGDKRAILLYCKQDRAGLQALIHPKLDLLRSIYEDLGNKAMVSSVLQGKTARIAWLGQRNVRSVRLKRRRVMQDQIERQATALLMTNMLEPALVLLKKGRLLLRANSLRKRHVTKMLCSVRAMSENKPTKEFIETLPHCQAVWAWRWTREGKAKKALQMLHKLGAYKRGKVPATTALFFATSISLAKAGKWQELRMLWKIFQQSQAAQHAIQTRDIFQQFNHIYRITVPPSLLHQLQSLIETQQMSTYSHPSWTSFVRWIRILRGRQTLMMGAPQRALQMYQSLSFSDAAIKREQMSLHELLKGPNAALSIWEKIHVPKAHNIYQALYLTQLGKFKKAQQALKMVGKCEKLKRHHRSLCHLLKRQISIKLNPKKMEKQAHLQKRMAKSRLFGQRYHRFSTALLEIHQKKRPYHLIRLLHHRDLGNIDPSLRAHLFFMELLDPTGKLTRKTLPQWSCTSNKQALDGHLLITYLLETLAKRTQAPSKWRKELFARRQKIGAMIKRMEELWLSLEN